MLLKHDTGSRTGVFFYIRCATLVKSVLNGDRFQLCRNYFRAINMFVFI
ncbi:unnamed protein product, partial [Brassica napus]